MATILDFGYGPPRPQAIKDAGHAGSICYVSTPRPGSGFTAKPISGGFVHESLRLGLGVAAVYQFGKDATADWRRGQNGGQEDARRADNYLASIGFPEAVIFASIDNDISESDWIRLCRPYLSGFGQVIGINRTGVYGSADTCRWAMRDRLIGQSTDPGKWYAWQTRGWSRGIIEPGICLYQRIVDTESSPGPKVDGTTVDVNDIYASDWGQFGAQGNWDLAYGQMMGSAE